MLDTYDEFSPNNPINQDEEAELTEMQQLEYYNWELFNKLKKAKRQIDYLIDLSVDAENGLLLKLLKQIKL